jgi:hypothetical protein
MIERWLAVSATRAPGPTIEAAEVEHVLIRVATVTGGQWRPRHRL